MRRERGSSSVALQCLERWFRKAGTTPKESSRLLLSLSIARSGGGGEGAVGGGAVPREEEQPMAADMKNSICWKAKSHT